MPSKGLGGGGGGGGSFHKDSNNTKKRECRSWSALDITQLIIFPGLHPYIAGNRTSTAIVPSIIGSATQCNLP